MDPQSFPRAQQHATLVMVFQNEEKDKRKISMGVTLAPSKEGTINPTSGVSNNRGLQVLNIVSPFNKSANPHIFEPPF